jgi:hypothetical protein
METSTGSDSNHGLKTMYPSMRDLPALGVTYADLARKVAMQSGIYETLTKQYELAKVQEAKDTPAVRVLDLPVVAERKSGPHRIILVLATTFLAAFFAVIIVVLQQLWGMISDSNPFKAFALLILDSVRRKAQTAWLNKAKQA